MPTLSANQRAELNSLRVKHSLSHFADTFQQVAQSAIQLLPVEPDDYGKAGVTRFGGVPDLPPEVVWPSLDGTYLTFVAQINLSEMPFLENYPLPTSGWLYFFLIDKAPADALAHKVIYYPGPTDRLKKTLAPQPQVQIDSGLNVDGNMNTFLIACQHAR
jgi:hypothetical protein